MKEELDDLKKVVATGGGSKSEASADEAPTEGVVVLGAVEVGM